MSGGTFLLILTGAAAAPDAPSLLHVGVGNDGTGPIDIGVLSIVGDSQFTISVDPASNTTLGPGQQVTVKVLLNTATPGTYTATLRVPSSDQDGTLDVALIGVVTAALTHSMSVAPAGTVDFGSVDKDTGSKVLPFTVTNTGTAPLVMGSVSKTGADYAISADGVSGVTIAPGASQGLYVTFDPTTVGTKTGTLTFPATGVSSVVVNLTGVSTAGAPAPTPTLVPRFYLTRQASPVAAIPDTSGWNSWTSDPDCLLATAKGGPVTSLGQTVNHVGVSGAKERLYRAVSAPMAAQSYSGHFTCLAIAYRSSYLGSNVTSAIRFGIWRVADSSVDWQPVASQGSAVSPWPDSTGPLPRRFPAGASGSWPVTLGFLTGDRLVVELGYRAFSTSSNGARLRYGGASTDTDLGDWETVQDLARAPWISFTGGLLVLP